MLVIRPITLDDLDQLEELAHQASFGLTTLPKDRQLLRGRVEQSVHGFAKMQSKPAGETYLFVMEDLTHGQIVGTSGIVSKVGGFDPFYAYKIETSVHESKMLKVHKEIRTLHLVRDHNGPCEIGSLFLSPDYRGGGNGRLLSLSRFLFMAQHSQYFDPVVIAELRGVVDDQGRAPFWEAIGRHFFEVEYPTADYLCMVDKKFIADLMPTHSIYIPLLPATAQEVIGQVHPHTVGARKILESEGFGFNGMVDIFEAGPIVSCALDEIDTIRRSREVVVSDVVDGVDDSSPSCVIGTTHRQFRACLGQVSIDDQDVATIDRVTALTLQIKIGDTIRYATTKKPMQGEA